MAINMDTLPRAKFTTPRAYTATRTRPGCKPLPCRAGSCSPPITHFWIRAGSRPLSFPHRATVGQAAFLPAGPGWGLAMLSSPTRLGHTLFPLCRTGSSSCLLRGCVGLACLSVPSTWPDGAHHALLGTRSGTPT